jgi:hypothetical protein
MYTSDEGSDVDRSLNELKWTVLFQIETSLWVQGRRSDRYPFMSCGALRALQDDSLSRATFILSQVIWTEECWLLCQVFRNSAE